MKGNIFAAGIIRGLEVYQEHMTPYVERLRKAQESGKGEEEARAAYWEAEERYRKRRAKR